MGISQKITKKLKKVLAFYFKVVYSIFCQCGKSNAADKIYGLLVKRLRRRPLTAKTGVRFPYRLLLFVINSPTQNACDLWFTSYLFFCCVLDLQSKASALCRQKQSVQGIFFVWRAYPFSVMKVQSGVAANELYKYCRNSGRMRG